MSERCGPTLIGPGSYGILNPEKDPGGAYMLAAINIGSSFPIGFRCSARKVGMFTLVDVISRYEEIKDKAIRLFVGEGVTEVTLQIGNLLGQTERDRRRNNSNEENLSSPYLRKAIKFFSGISTSFASYGINLTSEYLEDPVNPRKTHRRDKSGYSALFTLPKGVYIVPTKKVVHDRSVSNELQAERYRQVIGAIINETIPPLKCLYDPSLVIETGKG